MVLSCRMCTALVVGCLALIVGVSATMTDSFLKVPLFEVGSLWIRAIQDFALKMKSLILQPDLTSPWTFVFGAVGLYILYQAYIFFHVPMNRVRLLGDLGYIPEGKLSMKEMVNLVRKRRMVGEIPPPYPNGWFNVLESRDLGVKQVKNVSVLGKNLAVFRGEDGRAHIIDAYCPHMGANLAIGGLVKGDCLECPFHGWQFRGDDGKCTHIPYADSKTQIPDMAKVNSYITLERNGFIYMWHHAEKIEPFWMPPEIEEITRGEWSYRGRTEHIVNAHIEEVPENGADIAHLPQVHGPIMCTGIDLRYTYSKIWSFAKHHWDASWTQNEDPSEKHIGTLRLTHKMKFFGIPIPLLDMNVEAQQLGPGIVYLTFDSLFGKGAYLQALTPVEPLVQRMVHHVCFHWAVPAVIAKFFLLGEAMMIGPGIVHMLFDGAVVGKGCFFLALTPMEPLTQRMIHHIYMKTWAPKFIAKFLLSAEALMVERDIMIWNNKKYEGKPCFIKSKEDALVAKHRRWYSQFYSENSKRFKFQSDTMEW